MGAEYKIGQVLTAKEDLTLEGLFGKKKEVKKGSKIWIGADELAHHMDGTIQPLQEGAVVKGYDEEGIAEFIYRYFKHFSSYQIDEILEENDSTPDEFMQTIVDALNEIGI